MTIVVFRYIRVRQYTVPSPPPQTTADTRIRLQPLRRNKFTINVYCYKSLYCMFSFVHTVSLKKYIQFTLIRMQQEICTV